MGRIRKRLIKLVKWRTNWSSSLIRQKNKWSRSTKRKSKLGNSTKPTSSRNRRFDKLKWKPKIKKTQAKTYLSCDFRSTSIPSLNLRMKSRPWSNNGFKFKRKEIKEFGLSRGKESNSRTSLTGKNSYWMKRKRNFDLIKWSIRRLSGSSTLIPSSSNRMQKRLRIKTRENEW